MKAEQKLALLLFLYLLVLSYYGLTNFSVIYIVKYLVGR